MENAASVFGKQHVKVRSILEQAGSPARVLCVALDFAKAKHVVLFCNGFGDILKKAFPVENSPRGVESLLAEVQRTCKRRNILRKHVFFGGEDSPSYVQNFTARLLQENYLVVRVNAWEAKRQRDNHQASTDLLDLPGIAKALLHQPSYCDQDQPHWIDQLRELSRTRALFVAHATEQKLHVHEYVNRLLPGFLDPAQSGLEPFGPASLALLSESFSASHLRRWPRDRLTAFLNRHGQDHAEELALRLKALAGAVLQPVPHQLSCWQCSLAQHVQQYKSLQSSVDCLEREMAWVLAQSSGAWLTSISGIGVVLAAGIVAELGEGTTWRSLRRLCSYCGIIPRVEQTGGPDQPAKTGTVQHRCNPRAKNWIVQAGSYMGKCGPAELKAQHQALQRNGQHADFIMSKRLLRISKDLMRRGTVYRPKALLAPETLPGQLASYYSDLWPRLLSKWQLLRDRWAEVFGPNCPLGQWRQMAQQLYAISLPLPNHRPRKTAT